MPQVGSVVVRWNSSAIRMASTRTHESDLDIDFASTTGGELVVLWLAGGVSVVLLVVAEACLRFGLLDLGVP